jgi:glycosyltransferase involved in cell wall biosynthesis
MLSTIHYVSDLALESGGLSASVTQLIDSLLEQDSDLKITLLTRLPSSNSIAVAADDGVVRLPQHQPLTNAVTAFSLVDSSSRSHWKETPQSYTDIPLINQPGSKSLYRSYADDHPPRVKLMSINHLQDLSLTLRSFRKQSSKKQSIDAPYQLIHSHGLWLLPHHQLAQIAKKYFIPRVVTPHGMLQPWAMNHRRWKKHLVWNLYQYKDLLTANVLHATSPEEAKTLKQLFPNKPIALIPFGMSLANLPPLKTSKLTSKARALFLSRLHPVKGLKYLVEAWHILQLDNWELIIAGPDEGGHRAEIEQLINKLGMASSIHLVGAVSGDQKWQLYQSADLFVLPSLTESFGMVVVEALANGLPVVTTKGTPWSQLETEGCGWWIDVGVEALVNALRQATALNHMQRLAMGQQGRHLVEKQYTWEKSAEQMLSVYAWMLGSQVQPSCWFEDSCI